MYYIFILPFLLIVVFVFILYKENKTYKKTKKKIEALEEKKKNLSLEIESNNEEIQKLKELNSSITEKRFLLNTLTTQIYEKQNFNNSLEKIKEEEIRTYINNEKEKRLLKLDREIEEWSKSAQEMANMDFKEFQENYQKRKNQEEEMLNFLKAEVEDFKKKRKVINEEILRERKKKEQETFYCLQIDENSKHDIAIINSVRPQLYKFETLNKLLYDNYISKAAKELTKRVLNGENPSGIYKVTNINTKEVYIGKSTVVRDRWMNHIKSAYGLEGVADSQFQRALKTYGVENFTWELIEKVPKEKLNDAEKYWINFYDSKKYGLNEREG